MTYGNPWPLRKTSSFTICRHDHDLIGAGAKTKPLSDCIATIPYICYTQLVRLVSGVIIDGQIKERKYITSSASFRTVAAADRQGAFQRVIPSCSHGRAASGYSPGQGTGCGRAGGAV